MFFCLFCFCWKAVEHFNQTQSSWSINSMIKDAVVKIAFYRPSRSIFPSASFHQSEPLGLLHRCTKNDLKVTALTIFRELTQKEVCFWSISYIFLLSPCLIFWANVIVLYQIVSKRFLVEIKQFNFQARLPIHSIWHPCITYILTWLYFHFFLPIFPIRFRKLTSNSM